MLGNEIRDYRDKQYIGLGRRNQTRRVQGNINNLPSCTLQGAQFLELFWRFFLTVCNVFLNSEKNCLFYTI